MDEFDAENEIDDFDSLLTQGVKAIAGFDTGVTNERKTKREVYEQLGNLIGKAPSTIEYYCRGNKLDSPKQVEVLAREIVTKGRLDRRWLIKFLRSAGHHDPGPVCDELFPPSGRPAHLVNPWPDTGGPPFTADPGQESTPPAEAGTAVPDPAGSGDDSILASYFTDAKTVRDSFEGLITATTSPKRIVLIHGGGGVGKSSLLRMFRTSCRGTRIPVALVSAGEAKSPVEIMAGWAGDLSRLGLKLSSFMQKLDRYRQIQTSVHEQSRRLSVLTVTGIPSHAVPSFTPLTAPLIESGTGQTPSWLGEFLVKADVDLWLDPVQGLTVDFLADFHKVAANLRVVLLLDTYEQMTTYDDWLRTVVQRLPGAVIVVIAGRTMPDWSRTWPGWLRQTEVHQLKPMGDPEIRALIASYHQVVHGVVAADTYAAPIVRFARGLPIVVTSAIDLCMRYGYNVEDFEAIKPQVVSDLVDRLVEGVPAEFLPVLEAAAALRWFNRETLRAMLGVDVSRAYEELRHFPFVRPCAQGLALHDSVREMMDQYLRLHDPQRRRELHTRAAEFLEAQLATATGAEAETLAQERLYHRIRQDEADGIRQFQELAEQLVQNRLINRLQILLNGVKPMTLASETSDLWRKYYEARLMHHQEKLAEAQSAYIEIGENPRVEPKLRAYALCDLGQILTTRAFLQQDPHGQKAKSILERSLNQGAPLDLKLVSSLWELGNLYRRLDDLDSGMPYYLQVIDFVERVGAQYTATRLRLEMVVRRLYHGRFTAFADFTALVAEKSDVFARYPLLRIELQEGVAIPLIWMGRYAQAEEEQRNTLDELKSLRQFDYWQRERWGFVTRALCLAAGLQGKYAVAEGYFRELMAAIEEERLARQDVYRSEAYSHYGHVLLRAGQLEAAERLLLDALAMKDKIADVTGIPELLTWLGELQEVRATQTGDALSASEHLHNAASFYRPSADYPWRSRPYILCGALTGLVRVSYAQGNVHAISSLLAEAEGLAQRYEYNDHLALLRLTQGHMAWPSFDLALDFFQQALTYALRYNRFLLDEMLAGRPQGSPLRPLIPWCSEQGEDGRRMLRALRAWWLDGVNNVGTHRPDTISPIPEGIALREGERMARAREPADGTQQQYLVEQIDAALG